MAYSNPKRVYVDRARFGRLLREWMDDEGVSYRSLCSRTGVSLGMLSDIVNAKVSMSADVYLTLVDEMEVDPFEFTVS